jgi:hypothetical protein
MSFPGSLREIDEIPDFIFILFLFLHFRDFRAQFRARGHDFPEQL